MTLKTRLTYVFMALLALSCKPQTHVGQDTVQYVKDVLADKEGKAFLTLSGLGRPAAMDNICIIGTAAACNSLANEFMVSDIHDNVDAGTRPDGLPDFAGETVISIVDSLDNQYSSYVSRGFSEELRELTVRRAVVAIDTICHVSRYDLEGIGRKRSSKILVLADPYLEEYGSFDIDTLFRSTGCVVPVVSPIDAMIKAASGGKSRTMNIAVICKPEYEGSDIYSRRISERTKELGVAEVQCHCFAPADTAHSLTGILDRYVEAGGIKPLDVIMIDNPEVSAELVKAEISRIHDINCAESMIYGKLVAQEPLILESNACMVEACYNILRSNNLFSHKISYPDHVSFLAANHPAEDGCLILIPVKNVQD